MQKEKKILLSFDVEEFDLPLEYDQSISIEQQLEMGERGFHNCSHISMLKRSPPLFLSLLSSQKIFPQK